jgi:Acyl-CoA dehydrogenase, C-terminal domain
LGVRAERLPHSTLPAGTKTNHRTFREIRYDEQDGVGYLSFDFYNGAMSTLQCNRLRNAFLFARRRPTKVIVLLGGRDFFSNGIHLNVIEALDAIRVFGGYGYMQEYEMERVLRDAVGGVLHSGTSDMQRNIIASWLGL